MNHEKKYLKYKQKYLYLKSQYGGLSLDEINRKLVSYIIELEKYDIKLPEDINLKLNKVITDVKSFHKSKIKEMQEKKEILKQQKEKEIKLQQQKQKEKELNDLANKIIKMLWVFFYKTLCDTITNYHHSIIEQYRDDSLEIRTTDLRIKLQEVNQLLMEKWNYYLPPLLSDIIFSDSKLKKEMLFSEGFIDFIWETRKIIVPRVEPQYGYINPPQLKLHVPKRSFENLMSEYEELIEISSYYRIFESANHILESVDDVSQLLSDTWEEKNYAFLLTEFEINFRPTIHDENVPIDNLM
jgi:hypothetical protein